MEAVTTMVPGCRKAKICAILKLMTEDGEKRRALIEMAKELGWETTLINALLEVRKKMVRSESTIGRMLTKGSEKGTICKKEKICFEV